MSNILIQDFIYIILLIGLSIPLGNYIEKVMAGQKVFLSPVISPIERFVYRVMGTQSEDEMNPKEYASAVLVFSGIGFIVVFGVQILQNILPLNPERMEATSCLLYTSPSPRDG